MTEQERAILIETEQRAKSNTHRLNNFEKELQRVKEENKAIYTIATSVEVIATNVENIGEKVNEIKEETRETAKRARESEEKLLSKLSDVEHRPEETLAKNVNTIKMAAITAIITFLITGVLSAVIIFAK